MSKVRARGSREPSSGVGKRNSLGSLLDQTLAAAAKDVQTATARGQAVNVMIDGVSIRDLPTLTDERGSVFELYDVRWAWHPDALVFAHCSTIRPGFVKGWGLHKEHEDRFVVVGGEAMLVLFDPRPILPPEAKFQRSCFPSGSASWSTSRVTSGTPNTT